MVRSPSPYHRPQPTSDPWAPRPDAVVEAVGLFSQRIAAKLGRGGQDEDQLRAPTEELFRNLGESVGLHLIPYGEVALREFGVRPDYAVDLGRDRIGYIELKAPGAGVPPDWKKDADRNRRQYQCMRELPNLLYSDGTTWRLIRANKPPGPIVKLDGDIYNGTLRPSDDGSFHNLINTFLAWAPERPRSLKRLIKNTAGPCRILRATVEEILTLEAEALPSKTFSRLAADWRKLLFPKFTIEEFPDAYAQTVVFALLLARESGISFEGRDLRTIADQLRKQHPLMGRALHVLTHDDAVRQLKILETLRTIIGGIDWQRLPKGDRKEYWNLYEPFLKVYDKGLRQRSGSYYTPEPVAKFMIDLVEEVLRKSLNCRDGFAADDVLTMDPAMGTGTFLVEVIRSVAKATMEDHNQQYARAVLRDLCRHRLIGFERSAAPYVVAELRIHQTLKDVYETEPPERSMRFLTNTLDDPSASRETGMEYAEITESRNRADDIKRRTPIVAIVGNPPYLVHANRIDPAPWIESGRPRDCGADRSDRPALQDFREPDNGSMEKPLSNTAIYFWRWSTWKVFDAHGHRAGVVALITPSSFLKGVAFNGMRRYLRETCDEGWIIDLSPEGHRPAVSSRIFKDVKEPICIGIFVRREGDNHKNSRAKVRYQAIKGTTEEKFERMKTGFLLDGNRWQICQDGWTDDFLPKDYSAWMSIPQFSDIVQWGQSGIKPGVTWVYAPRPEVLRSRWARFIAAKNRKLLFKDPELGGREMPASLGEAKELPRIEACAFRAFDQQYVFADHLLVDRIRATLWDVRGPRQVYASLQHDQPIESGPAVIFTQLVPDQHHFGARGGKVFPLYKHSQGQEWAANIPYEIRAYIASRLGKDEAVTPEEVFAYIAAVAAHPGYTERFWDSLRRPGIRIPLTTDRDLWSYACSIGEEVIWLHTFGTRFHDVARGRPEGAPRLPLGQRPEIIQDISDDREAMPETISYEATTGELHVGDAVIGSVSPEAWGYRVCGRLVIRQWFSFRQRTRQHQKRTSPLDDRRVERWTYHLNRDLLDLINVLTRLVELQPRQETLLQEICDSPLITLGDLESSGLWPPTPAAKKAPRSPQQDELRYYDEPLS